MAGGANICMLADAQSVHTVRWCEALRDRGYRITVVSRRAGEIEGVRVMGVTEGIKAWRGIRAKLLPILKVCWEVRMVRAVSADVVHAHYATSYGLLGSMSGCRPFIVSAWGSDIMEFPKKSCLHRALVRGNLRRADLVCCTSKALAREAEKYGARKVRVIPFGIDCSLFKPGKIAAGGRIFTVGIVKRLDRVGGADLLIEAFNIFRSRYRGRSRLLVVGDGEERITLERQVEDLGIRSDVEFMGHVPHQKVAEELQKMSVAVFPSRREGFGVAALEAQACGVPVIVTNTGGLPEVVRDGESGFVVPEGDVVAIADRVLQYAFDRTMLLQMGAKARDFVSSEFSWSRCVDMMDSEYQRLV